MSYESGHASEQLTSVNVGFDPNLSSPREDVLGLYGQAFASHILEVPRVRVPIGDVRNGALTVVYHAFNEGAQRPYGLKAPKVEIVVDEGPDLSVQLDSLEASLRDDERNTIAKRTEKFEAMQRDHERRMRKQEKLENPSLRRWLATVATASALCAGIASVAVVPATIAYDHNTCRDNPDDWPISGVEGPIQDLFCGGKPPDLDYDTPQIPPYERDPSDQLDPNTIPQNDNPYYKGDPYGVPDYNPKP